MLIGIISDTHDDMEQIGRVVELFNSRDVKEIIHAGDFVSPFTFEVMGGLSGRLTAIFGNNDGDKVLLKTRFGDSIAAQPYMGDVAGVKVAIVHEPAAVEAFAKSGAFELVVYGHTHKPDVRNVNGTLIVNPGKVARLHKGLSTAALLDTDTMEVEIIEL
jgi:putative phosphoesterase